MDILIVMPRQSKPTSFCYNFSSSSSNPSNSNTSFFNKPFKTFCSSKGSSNGDNGNSKDNNNTGDKFSTDWDKAWSSFKRQSKKTLFSQFSPNKYVSWNPKRSNYPLSEEVDPIKRTERSNLMLWTSPRFTLAGAIVIISLLLVYTILAPTK